MELLIDAKLFHESLIEVTSPELIRRYNERLESLGIEPTDLQSFHIDGAGWSPEIALSRRDPFYLSAGPANPMAVILTPDQAHRPVHFPFNSYDPHLLHAYFQRYREEIADLTASIAIGVDIDHELTTYHHPEDLLLVDYVVVRSVVGDVAAAAKEQEELVGRIMNEELAWFDNRLRRAVIASAKRHGDLRFRKLQIPDMRFSEFGCFYTQALGGVFVLRDAERRPTLLITDEETEPQRRSGVPMFSVRDPRLVDHLLEQQYAEVNLKYYAENPRILSWKRDALVAHLLSTDDPEVDLESLTPVLRKQRLSALDDVPELLPELERLLKFLQHVQPSLESISPPLRLLLLHPNQRLSELDREVVARLIARLQPIDVVQLYLTDRNRFVAEYRDWPQSKRLWAVNEIKKRALPGADRISQMRARS